MKELKAWLEIAGLLRETCDNLPEFERLINAQLARLLAMERDAMFQDALLQMPASRNSRSMASCDR